EKDLFIQLSVFAGGFELAAAEGVADGTSRDVLSILTRLVDKSLVVAEPGAARQTRYRMLDTIREYAFEKLHDGDEAEIRRRHGQHFLEFTRRGHTELRGRHQLDWLNRLDEEQGNIRLALEWCLGEDPESALKLGPTWTGTGSCGAASRRQSVGSTEPWKRQPARPRLGLTRCSLGPGCAGCRVTIPVPRATRMSARRWRRGSGPAFRSSLRSRYAAFS